MAYKKNGKWIFEPGDKYHPDTGKPLTSKQLASIGKSSSSSSSNNNKPSKPPKDYVAPKYVPVPTAKIDALRNKIKNGQIDPSSAYAEISKVIMESYKTNGKYLAPQDFENAQNAVNSVKSALWSNLGTIKTMEGQFGTVDPSSGNVIQTSTKVVNSKTSAAGSSSSTKAVLPLDISSNLGPGSQSADVTKLQNWLKDQGYFPSGQAATGYYGDITKQAVAAWQKANGINAGADAGWFGPKSRQFLEQYKAISTQTEEDDEMFNSDEYKDLPDDQKNVVKSIFDAVSSNDEDMAGRITSALNKAKEFADPYFKQQVSIALDGLTRGFLQADQEFQYNERSLTQRLDDLKKTISESKEFLTLEQQADLKQLEQQYQSQLETTQNDLAAAGFGDSSRRTKTEGLLQTVKGDMVESSNRLFARKMSGFDSELGIAKRDTGQEIERLRQITQQDKINYGRKIEEQIGSDNMPKLPGYKNLGGVSGTLEQQYLRDVLNATNKFVF